MSGSERAAELFSGNYNCSQSVFMAFGERFGVDENRAARIAGGFGGGMGRMGEVCGALSGAFMVLGLANMGEPADDPGRKALTYDKVSELAKRFSSRHGSTRCRDLLGVDISTPDGHREAKERGLYTSLCPQFVLSAAEILEEMLDE